MSTADTERVMQAYTQQGPSPDTIAQDAVYVDVRTGVRSEGLNEIASMFETYYSTVFDAEADLLNSVAGADWFACEYRMTGRHIGEFAGKAGTGEEFTADFAVFYRVADGKVAEAHVYFPSEQVTR